MFSQYNGSVNIIVKIRNKHPQCPGFLGSSVVKNPPASAGAVGSIPGSGRSPGEENGNPLQYSCLHNPMDRRAWQATVHGVARVGHDLATKQQYTQCPSRAGSSLSGSIRSLYSPSLLQFGCCSFGLLFTPEEVNVRRWIPFPHSLRGTAGS